MKIRETDQSIKNTLLLLLIMGIMVGIFSGIIYLLT